MHVYYLTSVMSESWTVAHQAPLSMESSRQDYWSGQPFLSQGDLPNPETKPQSPALQADSLPSEPPGNPPCCPTNRFIGTIFLDSIHMR